MSAREVLGQLADVQGVIGSFVSSTEGDLLARNMPAFVEDAELNRVGPRLSAILAGFSEAGIGANQCLVRFPDHLLHLLSMDGGTLCILTGPEINGPALRMAARLVARKLGHVGLAAGTQLEAPPEQAPTTLLSARVVAAPPAPGSVRSRRPAPSAPESRSGRAGATPRRTIVYRGRTYNV